MCVHPQVIIKLAGFGLWYFVSNWNRFDMLTTCVTLFMNSSAFSAMRVIRFVRIFRVLNQLKGYVGTYKYHKTSTGGGKGPNDCPLSHSEQRDQNDHAVQFLIFRCKWNIVCIHPSIHPSVFYCITLSLQLFKQPIICPPWKAISGSNTLLGEVIISWWPTHLISVPDVWCYRFRTLVRALLCALPGIGQTAGVMLLILMMYAITGNHMFQVPTQNSKLYLSHLVPGA